MYDLTGKIALVTGAARGLGAGIARALAADGATVICADVIDATDTAEAIASETGATTWAAKLNITDREAATALCAQIVRKHGRLDILVNNAGIQQKLGKLQDIPDAEVARVLDINLRGPFVVSASAIPFLTKKTGRIINTASQYGVVGRPGHSVYSASKAGVIGMTQSLAMELASEGITVNCVCPGTMMTNMVSETFQEMASRQGLSVDRAEDLIEEFAKTIPLQRMGTSEDVGALVAWIASDASSFTTGASFNVAGGETLF